MKRKVILTNAIKKNASQHLIQVRNIQTAFYAKSLINVVFA